jgi:dihydrofolate reductase
MRKIVLSAWITLDGYVDSTEWLRGDDEMMAYEQSLVDSADTLLLGRKTFNDFASYWPSLASGATPAGGLLPMPIEHQRRYARTIDGMTKLVVSASGQVAPWRNVNVLSAIGQAEIDRLKHQPGKAIVMYGSLSVVRALSDLRMIDEYHLLLHPIFVGRGKSHFEPPGQTLEFDSVHPFRSGVVLMKYADTTNIYPER